MGWKCSPYSEQKKHCCVQYKTLWAKRCKVRLKGSVRTPWNRRGSRFLCSLSTVVEEENNANPQPLWSSRAAMGELYFPLKVQSHHFSKTWECSIPTSHPWRLFCSSLLCHPAQPTWFSAKEKHAARTLQWSINLCAGKKKMQRWRQEGYKSVVAEPRREQPWAVWVFRINMKAFMIKI